MRGMLATLAVFAAGAGMACLAHAEGAQVTFAGVAFSGAADTIAARFRHASAYENQLHAAGDSGYKHAVAAMKQQPAQNLSIATAPVAELKGRDQALVTALVLTSETVSVENFGDVRKLFIQERGQAVIFDFKSMTMVRSYPFSFAFIDNLRHDPTPQEIQQRVRLVFEGTAGKPGMYARYAQALATAASPAQVVRYLGVTQVSVAPEVVEQLPGYLKSDPAVYETWMADVAAEALSARHGVPMVPYAKGYAVGHVMSMQVADGDVYNLRLPEPDYTIGIDFKGLRKVKFSETGAGASWVYGALANLRIADTGGPLVYLDTPLKNAEVKVVPASQTLVDDFPAYDDAVHGLFTKLADAVAGGDLKWARAAAGAKDIELQLSQTKDLMNKCK
jgi:hypothetical protein